jgi:hypothetical protein
MTVDPPIEYIAEKLNCSVSLFAPRQEGAVQLILGQDNRHLFPVPIASSRDRIFSIQLLKSCLAGGLLYHGALGGGWKSRRGLSARSSGFKSEEEEAVTKGDIELELSSESVKPAKSAAAAATAATTAASAAMAATAARPAAQPAHREDEQAGGGHKSVEREAAPDGYMKLELLSEILHRVEDKAAKSAAMAVSTAAAATAAGPAVQSVHKKWRQIGGGHKPEEESPDGPSRKKKRRQARQDGGEDNAGGGDGGGDCNGGGGHYSVLSEARSRMRRYLNWGGWQRHWGSYDVPQSDMALHSVPMESEKKALATSASTPEKE